MIRMPRLVVALTSGALALGLSVGATGAASAASADRAGDWLEKQLTGGLIHNDAYDFDDYGLTADTGMALVAVGGHRKAVKQTTRALADHVDSWTTGADFGSGDVYAGSVAKALVFAQTAGVDPKNFGGVDLVKRLGARISSEKGTVGRLQDKTADTDYANTLGQAYAAAGLSDAGSKKARATVGFLLAQQCEAGFFRLYFADADAQDQTCDGAARKKDRAPDTDATAIAVVALQSIDRPTARVEKSVASALAWLERTQGRDGGFRGGRSTTDPNANSTGLAAWALARGGECEAAKRAATWVRTLQRKDGAVAYDKAALKAGVSADTLDQWRRATAQAAPGLTLPGC